MQNLKQTGHIKNNVNHFRQIMGNVSKMTEIDKIHLFLNGLNKQIKEHIGTTEPVTLEDAINTAQTFAAYHCDDNVRTVTVSNAKMNEFIRSKGKQPPGQVIDCFNCGKKGHYARNCQQPKRNGSNARQHVRQNKIKTGRYNNNVPNNNRNNKQS